MNEIIRFSANQLARKIRNRELGAVEVLDAHVGQIEALNEEINALVTLCLDRAFDEAKLADQKRQTGETLGVLHGLPYAVKDTLPTKDVRTTFGSLLFENHIPGQDALHVERARQAGAIVIGKSNSPQFACGAQTDNPLFGITRNPVDRGKTVTGSSGGAAAALAAHMVPMADGSDLGGSLRTPASVCGVVGFRPTAGQVPKRENRLPFDGLHVFGPMARSVEDIALFMSVFAGRDAACPLSAVATEINYEAALQSSVLGTRIAFSVTPCGVNTHNEVKSVLNSLCPTFESIGCHVEEACPDIGDNHSVQMVAAALNAITELGDYLQDERFARSERLRMFLQKGQALKANDIATARNTQARCWQTISEFFLHYDFLLWPTMAGLPFDIDLAEGEIDEDWRPVELTPSLNLPAVALPAGLSTEGLPVGLQLIGPPNSDFRLLQLAYAFQQALGSTNT